MLKVSRRGLIIFHDPKFSAEGNDPPDHLLLHEVEAHSYDGHTEEDVEAAEDKLDVDDPSQLGLTLILDKVVVVCINTMKTKRSCQ